MGGHCHQSTPFNVGKKDHEGLKGGESSHEEIMGNLKGNISRTRPAVAYY